MPLYIQRCSLLVQQGFQENGKKIKGFVVYTLSIQGLLPKLDMFILAMN